MNTVIVIAQCALFAVIVGLPFPINTHPLEFLALATLNAVLLIAYGATKND